MKKWTIEDLYELWRDRGYGKKAAMKKRKISHLADKLFTVIRVVNVFIIYQE